MWDAVHAVGIFLLSCRLCGLCRVTLWRRQYSTTTQPFMHCQLPLTSWPPLDCGWGIHRQRSVCRFGRGRSRSCLICRSSSSQQRWSSRWLQWLSSLPCRPSLQKSSEIGEYVTCYDWYSELTELRALILLYRSYLGYSGLVTKYSHGGSVFTAICRCLSICLSTWYLKNCSS